MSGIRASTGWIPSNIHPSTTVLRHFLLYTHSLHASPDTTSPRPPGAPPSTTPATPIPVHLFIQSLRSLRPTCPNHPSPALRTPLSTHPMPKRPKRYLNDINIIHWILIFNIYHIFMDLKISWTSWLKLGYKYAINNRRIYSKRTNQAVHWPGQFQEMEDLLSTADQTGHHWVSRFLEILSRGDPVEHYPIQASVHFVPEKRRAIMHCDVQSCIVERYALHFTSHNAYNDYSSGEFPRWLIIWRVISPHAFLFTVQRYAEIKSKWQGHVLTVGIMWPLWASWVIFENWAFCIELVEYCPLSDSPDRRTAGRATDPVLACPAFVIWCCTIVALEENQK